MAEMARNYHDELQDQDMNAHLDKCDAVIKDLLKNVTAMPAPEIIENLKKTLTREKVETALKLSKDGTAPGLNGAPYELYKTINAWYKIHTKNGDPAFDVVNLLTLAFIDIQLYGVDPTTSFTE
ncbi:hypothetical protein EDD85DRAFT_734897, partial [Armillaria nabsnona]